MTNRETREAELPPEHLAVLKNIIFGALTDPSVTVKGEVAEVKRALNKAYALATAAARERIRAEALEEAAKVCERESKRPSSLWEETGCWNHASMNCADAVRALKTDPQEGEG